MPTLNAEERRNRALPAKWDGVSAFKIKQVAEIFDTHEWTIYEAIKRKEIPAVAIGKALRVPRLVVEMMLAGEQV
jgi:excisionase family DNA binding protein